MSHAHDIDNDDHFFYFDPYDGPSSLTLPDAPFELHHSASPPDHHFNMSSHDDQPTSEELRDFEVMSDAMDKGKGVTKPMPIPPSSVVNDVFEMSPSTSYFASSSHDDFSLYSSASPSSHDFVSMSIDSYHRQDIDQASIEGSTAAGPSTMNDGAMSTSSKGKQRESPPTLPPLSFSPTGLVSDRSTWLSPTPASSPDSIPGGTSIGGASTSGTGGFIDSTPSHSISTSAHPEILLLHRMPSRRRSFSNLSIHTRHKVKSGAMRSPGSLARALLFKRRAEPPSGQGARDPAIPALDAIDATSSSCFVPWGTDLKAEASFACTSGHALGHSPVPATIVRPYKGKGRSHSAPSPFSVFDIIPTTPSDAFAPIPIVVKNYFDEVLPRELRLRILTALLFIHQEDHERIIHTGHWTMARASSSKGQWVGRDKGLRELVKFSRVSKGWQSLVFDGELWQDLNLRSFPALPVSLVLRITQSSGAFIKSLNITGHAGLDSDNIIAVTNNLCLASDNLQYTQLTTINLQGCTGLKTRSLHHLLVRSKHLQKLTLKGLSAVNNNTCNIIVAYCPNLIDLDLSRCSNLDAEGIRKLATAVLSRGDQLVLKALRLCGLKHIDDDMMALLGRAAPRLEVLDLSYCRHLHNSAIEAFVAVMSNDVTDQTLGVRTVMIPGRDIGRVDDITRYRRRVTRLRHLSLSNCVLLTDVACSNLAGSVPDLEFLELAGIGAELHDDGLVRLLGTMPKIRRLDLEDASEITDELIEAITPRAEGTDDDEDMDDEDVDVHMEDANLEPQPGHALEYLNISHSMHISDEALLGLIHRCPNLKALEVDNTKISGKVLREFVKRTRERKMADARINAVDCRGVNESVVKELAGSTRPRQGFRRHDARKLKYVDGRDGYLEEIKDAQDECDESRVVLKSFYSWQAVDAIKVEREKRKKANASLNAARRILNGSTGSATDLELDGAGGLGGNGLAGGRLGRTRWWSPGGRSVGTRSARAASPNVGEMNGNEGCIIM